MPCDEGRERFPVALPDEALHEQGIRPLGDRVVAGKLADVPQDDSQCCHHASRSPPCWLSPSLYSGHRGVWLQLFHGGTIAGAARFPGVALLPSSPPRTGTRGEARGSASRKVCAPPQGGLARGRATIRGIRGIRGHSWQDGVWKRK